LCQMPMMLIRSPVEAFLELRREARAEQLTRGQKVVAADAHGTATTNSAAEPPAVVLSSPAGHPLGAVVPPEESGATQWPAAGLRNDSGDHNRDKSLQSTTVISATESEISRQTPCKLAPSNGR
jgi:hypothetical protein